MARTATIEIRFPVESDIPEKFQYGSILDQSEYLLNGRIETWTFEHQPVYSPIYIEKNGITKRKLIGRYPLMNKSAAIKVLEAAETSFDQGKGKWATMAIRERIEHLFTFTERLKQKKEKIVNLLMWEIGKTIKGAETEFDRTIQNISDTIGELRRMDTESSKLITEEKVLAQMYYTPRGIVLCMAPFNFPLNESFATLIPALAMGNSVIFKPPKYGVLLHYPLLEVFRDCFPDGVINTIYGDEEEVVKPILESGKVNMLAFIGTSKVANILRSYHPKPNRLKEVYGMDAKNPGIILSSADIDFSVTECLNGALSFNGQRCTALKILFVHRSVIDEFLEKFSTMADSVQVGMPWEDVMITPLPEENRPEYLNELVKDAITKGAHVTNYKGGLKEKSIFYPTVLYPVNNQMRIFHEEQFGPVVPVVSFDDINEPMDYIFQSDYGQQVSIFGSDREEISTLVKPLLNQVGRVNINSLCQRGPDNFPFTGRKDSAKGTLSVSEALKQFSVKTVLATKETGENEDILAGLVERSDRSY